MGRGLKHVPAERKAAFETSDKAEWGKRLRCDMVAIPRDEVLKTVVASELLSARGLL